MGFARIIVSAALAMALVAYAFDCSASATKKQAMQCCHSMRCMSHHQSGQDCCKTMPAAHADLGQPASVGVATVPVAVGVAAECYKFPPVTTPERIVADQSNPPPTFRTLTILSLRI